MSDTPPLPSSPSPTPAPATPPPSPAPAPGESEIRQWHMWCHLSALAGLLVPFGNVLGPLVVWQMKKAEIPSVEIHGKAALNFQLTVLIAVVACTIVAVVLSFFCIGWLLFPVVLLLVVAGFVFAVIAGIQANEGKEYKYPYSLKLI